MPKPRHSIIDQTRGRLRQQIRRLIRRPVDKPVRAERMFAPTVRSLEPRFVLNATAELTAMGLMITSSEVSTGIAVNETVNLEVDSAGDLLLRDGNGDVIPITNHPDGPAAERSPIHPADIMGGQIAFDMLGGNDTLNLQLPSGLNVVVQPGGDADTDTANLQFTNRGDVASRTFDISSASIHIDPSPSVAIVDDNVRLQGNVFVGSGSGRSLLDLGTGSLQVEGRLTLQGDVTVIGSQASVDLSMATVAADTADRDLRFVLGNDPSATLQIGDVEPTIGDLAIVSARSVTLENSSIELSGDLIIRGVAETIQVNSDIFARSVIARSDGDLVVSEMIISQRDITLQSSAGSLLIANHIDSDGAINLSAPSIVVQSSNVTTSGGLISVSGPVQIAGAVEFDSGSGTTANAGRIQFFSSISSDDGVGDRLEVSALGLNSSGTVRIQGTIGDVTGGNVATPVDAKDLDSLIIDAGQIEINSIGVSSGNIDLNASTTRLFGPEIRTNGGDIRFNTALLLPLDDTDIMAAGQVEFVQRIEGQLGTGNLTVTAGSNAIFLGTVSRLTDLIVMAPTIRIAADVDTTQGATDGMVRLTGGDLVSVEAGANVFVGNSTILIDGNGGVVDTRSGQLTSNSSGEAITIHNASRVQLGNVVASAGILRIGVGRDITGLIDQADATSVMVRQFTASSTAAIDLSQATNQIAEIMGVDAQEITITDSLDDLIVAGVNSNGNNVTLFTPGSLRLFDVAVIAIGATTTLTGEQSIVDLQAGNAAANIDSGNVFLIAGLGGIGEIGNAVDVNATVSLNATSVDPDSNILLANVPGAILIGLIDAGDGNVNLEADSINDASDDAIMDIVANQLVMTSNSGIGNLKRVELFAIAGLTGTTNSGGINLDLEATRATIVHNLFAGQGDIHLQQDGLGETAAIRLVDVTTNDGAITVNVGGTLTAINVTSRYQSNVEDSDVVSASHDVMLTTRGTSSDIIVQAISALNSADVQLFSGDDIYDSNIEDNHRIVADDLTLVANNQDPEPIQEPRPNAAIFLATDVADLQAEITGAERGDLEIRELDSINLASSDDHGDEIVKTKNGQITVRAGNEIQIFDFNTNDEGIKLTLDPEIHARGLFGRIDLQADSQITLNDAVQLQAEKKTVRTSQEFTIETNGVTTTEMREVVMRGDAAVYLKAGVSTSTGVISLGDRIEINTGANQGVARVFGPRPDFERINEDPNNRLQTAFFDVKKVRTNILEQSDVNDATGILTLDIGQQGEMGLTVNIDWGAPTLRFQQIDGLSADAALFVPRFRGTVEEITRISNERLTYFAPTPTEVAGDPLLSIEHKYTEANILFTRFNDRAADTKPIEVRFSVRHHESIVVLGSTIVQGEDQGMRLEESIPLLPEEGLNPQNVALTRNAELSRVVSATDNDDPTIQDQNRNLTHTSGRISFVIPSLSIPVAFFPVRDVIPVIETPEFIVRSESIVTVSQGTVETVEAGTSTSSTREEYFRIRVLSPDPDADEDLASQRLPDDILSGDKLKRLLEGSKEDNLEALPDGQYEIEYVMGDGNEISIFRFDLRGGVPTSLDDGLDEGVLKLRLMPTGNRGETGGSEQSGEREESDERENTEQGNDESLEVQPPRLPISTSMREGAETNLDHTTPASTAAAVFLTPMIRRLRAMSTEPQGRLTAAGRFAERMGLNGEPRDSK